MLAVYLSQATCAIRAMWSAFCDVTSRAEMNAGMPNCFWEDANAVNIKREFVNKNSQELAEWLESLLILCQFAEDFS